VLLEKLDKSDHAVQVEEEDLRAVHFAMLSEQKKYVNPEYRLYLMFFFLHMYLSFCFFCF